MMRGRTAKLWRLIRREIKAITPVYLMAVYCVVVSVVAYWAVAALWESRSIPNSLTAPLTWIDTHTNLLLVVITGVYAWLTYGLLRESRATRLSALASEVVVDVAVDQAHQCLECIVRNMGRSPARDIRVITNPPLLDHRGKDLVPLRIAGLGPGQQRRYLIGFIRTYLHGESPRSYEVTVTWADSAMGALSRTSTMDVGSFEQAMFDSDPTRDIADQLRDIARSMHFVGRTGISAVGVSPLSQFERRVLEKAEALNTAVSTLSEEIARGRRTSRPLRTGRRRSPKAPTHSCQQRHCSGTER